MEIQMFFLYLTVTIMVAALPTIASSTNLIKFIYGMKHNNIIVYKNKKIEKFCI